MCVCGEGGGGGEGCVTSPYTRFSVLLFFILYFNFSSSSVSTFPYSVSSFAFSSHTSSYSFDPSPPQSPLPHPPNPYFLPLPLFLPSPHLFFPYLSLYKAVPILREGCQGGSDVLLFLPGSRRQRSLLLPSSEGPSHPSCCAAERCGLTERTRRSDGVSGRHTAGTVECSGAGSTRAVRGGGLCWGWSGGGDKETTRGQSEKLNVIQKVQSKRTPTSRG